MVAREGWKPTVAKNDQKRLGKKHRQASTRPKKGRAPRVAPTTGAIDPRKRKAVAAKKAAVEKAKRVPKKSPEREARVTLRGDQRRPPASVKPPRRAPMDDDAVEQRDWREAELEATRYDTAKDSVDTRAPLDRDLRASERGQIDPLQPPHRIAPLDRRRRARHHARPHLRRDRVGRTRCSRRRYRRRRAGRRGPDSQRDLPPGSGGARRGRCDRHGRRWTHRAGLAGHGARSTAAARRQAGLPRGQQDGLGRAAGRRGELSLARIPQRSANLGGARHRHRRPARRGLRGASCGDGRGGADRGDADRRGRDGGGRGRSARSASCARTESTSRRRRRSRSSADRTWASRRC